MCIVGLHQWSFRDVIWQERRRPRHLLWDSVVRARRTAALSSYFDQELLLWVQLWTNGVFRFFLFRNYASLMLIIPPPFEALEVPAYHMSLSLKIWFDFWMNNLADAVRIIYPGINIGVISVVKYFSVSVSISFLLFSVSVSFQFLQIFPFQFQFLVFFSFRFS